MMKSGWITSLVVYIFIIVSLLFTLFPLTYMIIGSFKTTDDWFRYPWALFPQGSWQFSNYVDTFDLGVGTFLGNSFSYVSVATIMQLVFAPMAGFAFARLRFKGRDIIFMAILATMMIPFAVTMVPLYILVKSLGIHNSIYGFVLPFAVTPFGVFLMRQFYRSIPQELVDAAYVDGASTLDIYFRIMLPLSKGALLTLGLLSFLYLWDEFTWSLILFTDRDRLPLTVGLSLYQEWTGASTQLVTNPGILMAALAIGALPLALAFVILQKYLIKGATLSGLKM